jgi:hypothetical protein
MTTKAELITRLKSENPKAFHNVNGVQTEIKGAAYDALVNSWAEVELAKIAIEEAAVAAKATAQAKLEALGLTTDDLKALGL